MNNISVVINTCNEGKYLDRALNSLKWADEIVVVDMNSEDDSVKIAKEHGAKVFYHKRMSFVEPARNFAVSKALGKWILILDPDEEVTQDLANKLKEITQYSEEVDYVRIPRKNLIFNKWMKASMWWPDLNVRFFQKGKVKWSDKIHIQPQTQGQGLDLPEDEKLAIIHHHYTEVNQFIERMNRYTTVQAEELVKDGYKFYWKDIVVKPLSEFLGRYFANKGFQDGLHGLALSLLQSLSFVVVYLKVWELQGFKQHELNFNEIKDLSNKSGKELNYWFKYGNLSTNPAKRFFQKLKNKIS